MLLCFRTFRVFGGAICCAALTLTACRDDARTVPADGTVGVDVAALPKREIPVPAFSADSAYAHVARQVGYGPRVPNSEAHTAARRHITSTLERYGAQVTVQEFPAKFFDGNRATGYNLIGSYNPTAKRRMFVCAHYDSRPFADSELETQRRDEPVDGADDGGSGVGVMLEIGRLLDTAALGDFGVDLVFFDLEDYGNSKGKTEADSYTWALGSQHWARQPHVDGYGPQFGILLDMVGAEGAVFGREQYSKRFAPDVQERVWRLAQKMNRGDRFVDASIGYATDDHYFVNTIAGWPTIDIIYKPIGTDGGFGAHWHTHEDDMDIISRKTLGDVGQVVTAVVYRAAGNML